MAVPFCWWKTVTNMISDQYEYWEHNRTGSNNKVGSILAGEARGAERGEKELTRGIMFPEDENKF